MNEMQDVYDRLVDTIEGLPDDYEVDSIVWSLVFALANFGHNEEAKEEIKSRVTHLLGPDLSTHIAEPSGRIILAH